MPGFVRSGHIYMLSEKNTHNTLLTDYETLEYDCRHYSKRNFKVWWHRETASGLEVQKAAQMVTCMADTCEAGVYAQALRDVHSHHIVCRLWNSGI